MAHRMPDRRGSPATGADLALRTLAVRERNAAFDGAFWYGVRTTRVFCRPSCPSRAARPQNLVFFDHPDAASRAGFRPCRRCLPLAKQVVAPAVAAIRTVCEHIAAHATDELSLADLARLSGFSAGHLQRTFRRVVGVSPKEFQIALRVAAVKRDLRGGQDFTQAAHAAGFSGTGRAYEHVERDLAMTPSSYRAGGRGLDIHYACRHTRLGLLMMAATERGVCYAQFGESRDALADCLAKEFPNAKLMRSGAAHSPELNAWIVALEQHLAGGGPSPDLPLDLRGTAFQLRVWQCLRAIRPGETVSYSELARRIGASAAVRAAASACARNRIAVLIPCHRVLRQDCDLGGYRWGLERKRALLELEASALPAG